MFNHRIEQKLIGASSVIPILYELKSPLPRQGTLEMTNLYTFQHDMTIVGLEYGLIHWSVSKSVPCE